jgi:hypothetical protein
MEQIPEPVRQGSWTALEAGVPYEVEITSDGSVVLIGPDGVHTPQYLPQGNGAQRPDAGRTWR